MMPREQGNLGEFSAIDWLCSAGAVVCVPIGHSPDFDVMAEWRGRAIRVQVKTTTHYRADRWTVMLRTRGGNRSWSGTAKYFSSSRCDYLFVLVADGRRWFIPVDAIDGRSVLVLGGPKYAQYEVEPGRAIPVPAAA